MEHVPSFLQATSLGGVGVLLAHPDGAHLALYGIIFTGLCSIVTTSMNRRADRAKDEARYAHEKEEREFQALQVREAFTAATEQRERNASKIVAKVEESTSVALASADASMTAIDVSNHVNEKLTRITQALGVAVKTKK